MSVYRIRSSNLSLLQFVNSLQLRTRPPDEAERQKFEHSQVYLQGDRTPPVASVQKILTAAEIQPKEKHIRNIILGTFHEEGAYLFWTLMTDVQLESHPVICWKFCYLLHRLLRDGHNNVLKDSFSVSSYIQQLGKFWSALPQQYGAMIQGYCNLLSCKLAFHQKFPYFPGNLQLAFKDLRSLIADSQDAYFEICAESLDYLDSLLDFGNIVLRSIDQPFTSSMTVVGQSRLLPLVSCIHEANTLYDLIVKTLFEMHSVLQASDLEGHRNRFSTIFRRLQDFFNRTKNMQFFTGLIQIPVLPKSPPDFKLRESLSDYQTPVCVLSETPSVSSALSVASSQSALDLFEQKTPVSSSAQSLSYPALPSIDETVQAENEELKRQLQNAANTVRLYEGKILEAHESFERMRNELKSKQEALDALRAQLSTIDSSKETSAEEKYEKMKTLYTGLREQHVAVLRRESEMKKQLAELSRREKLQQISKDETPTTVETSESIHGTNEVSKIESKEANMSRLMDLEKEVSSLKSEKAALVDSFEDLKSTIAQLKLKEDEYLKKISEASAESNAWDARLNEQMEQNRNLILTVNELKSENKSLKEEKESLMASTKNSAGIENHTKSLSELVTKLKKELADTVAERDECRNELIKSKESLIAEIADKDKEINEIKDTIGLLTTNFNELQEKMRNIEVEKDRLGSLLTVNRGQVHAITGNKLELEENLMDLLHEKESVDEKLSIAAAKCLEQEKYIEVLTNDVIKAENSAEEKILEMRNHLKDHAIASCEYTLRNVLSSYGDCIQSTPDFFATRVQQCMGCLEQLNSCFVNDSGIEFLVSALYAFCNSVCTIVLHSRSEQLLAAQYVTEIANLCSDVCLKSLELLLFIKYIPNCIPLAVLHITGRHCFIFATAKLVLEMTITHHVEKFCLCENDISALLNRVLEKIMNVTSTNVKDIDDGKFSLDAEIKSVADLLTEAQSKFKGFMKDESEEGENIKELEKDQKKFIECCLEFVAAVHQVVSLTGAMQKEMAHFSNPDAEEVYKNNHIWTESLLTTIGAIKSNTQNFVTFTESILSNGEAKYEELIVCIQNICAGTTQFVAASNVKTAKSSENKTELIEASKKVTRLTGTLLSLTRNASESLEAGTTISQLTPEEARRREVEARSRVAQLQRQLEQENQVLTNLKKQCSFIKDDCKSI